MSKTINISDEAYEWILNLASNKSIQAGKSISMAEVVDELIKN